MKKNVLKKMCLTLTVGLLLGLNVHAQTEHVLNNDFRTGSSYGWVINGSPYTNYTGNVPASGQATYSSSSIITEGGLSRMRIVAGQNGGAENLPYRSDIQKQNTKTTSATNKVVDPEITIYKQFPIIAIKWNRPVSRSVTFSDNNTATSNPGITLDSDLGDFRRGSNNDSKITVSGNTVVSYWDMSKGFFKPATTNPIISALTDATNLPVPASGETLVQGDSIRLAMLQIKIADIKMSSADKASGMNLLDIFWIKTFASVEALQAYIDGNEPLPVSLTDYTVKLLQNGNAILNWKVSSEQSNQYFLIERKTSEGEFTEIGRIPSKGTGASIYSFTDINDLIGVNYYRLSQVDIDGTKRELGIQWIKNSLNVRKDLNIFPLPVIGDKLSFSYLTENKEVTVSIYSLTGEKILNQNLAFEPSGIYTLEFNNKPSGGMYLITVDNQQSKKIIIN